MNDHIRRRRQRPEGATVRRFELYAVETWLDDQGRVLQFDHGCTVRKDMEPDTRQADHQRTFDEWLEEEIFWDHYLNSPEGQEAEDAED